VTKPTGGDVLDGAGLRVRRVPGPGVRVPAGRADDRGLARLLAIPGGQRRLGQG
jgi:hypothetical protein